MSDFTRQFLNEPWEELTEAPRVYLGAFGKHPAWNDHLDDIGLVTASLVMARRIVYGTGVASQIESATWDKAGTDKTLPTFHHTVFWRRGGETLVGRLWSSKDGKGRALYPMALLAHLVGVSAEGISTDLLPLVREAEARCVASRTSSEVLAVLSEAQARLRRRAAAEVGPVVMPDSRLGLAGLARHATDHPEVLARVVHHLRVNFGLFVSDDRGWAEDSVAVRSKTLRLPRWMDAPGFDALHAWTSLLAALLDPAVPLLAFLHEEHPWIDVVVGEPTPNDFYLLKANAQAVPVVSDIPYQVDPPAQAAANQVLQALASDRIPGQSVLTGKTLVESRTSADRWMARQRGSSGGGGFLRKIFAQSATGFRFPGLS